MSRLDEIHAVKEELTIAIVVLSQSKAPGQTFGHTPRENPQTGGSIQKNSLYQKP